MCTYRIFASIGRKKGKDVNTRYNKRKDELFLYKSFHCFACAFAFKFLINKATENPKVPHLKIFLAHIASQVCDTFRKHWCEFAPSLRFTFSVTAQEAISQLWKSRGKKAEVEPAETNASPFSWISMTKPKGGVRERPASSSFLGENLGLPSKANLPSAIKGIGDCGEFWACSTGISCLPSSSAQGILQARIPEWVATAFSGGSSRPRGLIPVSRTAGDSLPSEPAGTSFLCQGV